MRIGGRGFFSHGWNTDRKTDLLPSVFHPWLIPFPVRKMAAGPGNFSVASDPAYPFAGRPTVSDTGLSW